MATARSYGDPCGIARALDHLGERWALLIVRELMLGPKRFTDIREGLTGASPNVLSQRLAELETSGVVKRVTIERPIPAQVYELTPRGYELRDVVLALGRWGSRSTPMRRGELSVDALMLALLTTFDANTAQHFDIELELRIPPDRFRARVADGRIDITRGDAKSPDAILTTTTTVLRNAVFGMSTLEQAMRSGALAVEGNQRKVARFMKLFPRPSASHDATD